jgi:hypothetical protein
MTVDISSKRPRAFFSPCRLPPRALLLIFLVAASVTLDSSASAQRKPNSAGTPRADSTGESTVYPVGDAVGVYTAVLDLLYVDGSERAPLIVLWDTAQRQSGGPCSFTCEQAWLHKSKIDTAAVLAYARPSRGRPRIIDFGYRIPIVPASQDAFERMTNDGYAYLADRPPDKVGPLEAFWAGFRRKYPRAWGYAMLSKVGFNAQHTEALIGVFQVCGENCRSFETIFLKRFGKRWRVIERIPEYAEAYQTLGEQRYRGPAGERQDQSQIVAIDASGSPPRAESDDAAGVYRAVLDSLYSFHGDSPRSIVITATRAYAMTDLKAHRSRIDSSTITSFKFNAAIHDGSYPRFKNRTPITWISADAMKNLERDGAPLAKVAVERVQEEQSPLWLAFHARYPRAWGYASLGRPGFNPRHTQALVVTQHFCGTYCVNTDIWFLERTGERWYVVERMPGQNQAAIGTEGLRYLGPDADAKWYRPRRVRGVVTNALTDEPRPSLDIAVYQQNKFWRTIRTDSKGRYTLSDLPMNGGILFKVRCPIAARSDSLWGGDFGTRPGLDTTINVALDYRHCVHLNRTHPLIANATKWNTGINSAYPSPADEAVYLGVLRALHPSSTYESGQILLLPFTSGQCDDCFETEVPRLVKKGLMDPSTEINFAGIPKDPLRLKPLVPYKRKVEVMVPEDQELFSDPAAHAAMKDAYPGASGLVGFSRVGFNATATEALVEVRTESVEAGRETMLLKKTGSEWRPALRHVEREATSGEWSGNKCEATDAPDRHSIVAEIGKLVGDFEIVRVGVSRQIRGHADSVRIRLGALTPSPRRASTMVATAAMLDARDNSEEKIAGTLETAGSYASITFITRQPEGVVELDGWINQYAVLRTNGREFFGTWLTGNGPGAGVSGYFCARSATPR